MSSVSFLSSHHDPHCPPLGVVDGLDDSGDLIHECDCSCDVVEDLDVLYLLPWHGDVLQEFEDGVRGVFQCA